MNEIQVRLLEQSENGRLYYRPDHQVHPFVYYLENPKKEKKRAFSINIDSAVIIDLNKDYLVQSVEFNIHKKIWQSTPDLIIPAISISADIHVTNLKETNALVEKQVTSKTNYNQSITLFTWMEVNSDGNWIKLSDQCFAYILDSYLGGFLVQFN